MDWTEFRTGSRQALVGLGYSPETVRTYTDAVTWLGRWARDAGLEPADITTAHLLQFMGSHPRWGRATRAMVRCAIRAAYRWAIIAGHVTINPGDALPAARKQPPAPHPAPEHAYASALRAASAREVLMLRLAAECGLRRAEVAQVHPQRDMREDEGGWSLIAHGKGSKDRVVPLPADIAHKLRLAGPGYLFPGKTDGHLAANTVGIAISRLLPDGVSMHALRHRFASVAYEATGDMFAVQQLLGHASAATTQVYVLVGASTRRRVVEAVAQAGGGSGLRAAG
jgi:integrase/recombinase XerC